MRDYPCDAKSVGVPRGSGRNDLFAIIPVMHVGVVVVDGFFGAGASSIVDILAIAEMVRPEVDPSIPPLALEIVAPRRRVRSTSGVTINATRSLGDLEDLDLVVVPAFATITSAQTIARVEERASRNVIRALRAIDPARCQVAGACTGVFLLAETGMLDGRRATTSWFLIPTFRTRYPGVSVDLDRMVVADGPTLTAGAGFAHIDLALVILGRISPQLARHVARLLLVDERPSQAAYIRFEDLRYDDPLLLAFESHVRQHLDQPFNLSRAARAVGASPRTLERRTHQVVGMTPVEIVQRLRLERASHLRRTTNLSMEAIAERVGYADAETLRALRRRNQAQPTRC
jgi:transcriptional regulator GlxA family with amidase domain